MAKNQQLIKLIEAMVKKEVSKILPTLVPHVVKEVMVGMIMETTVSPPPASNSTKRHNLMEGVLEEFEEYPTMGTKHTTNNMASLLQHSRVGAVGLPYQSDEITLDHAVTEAGQPVPIDPSMVPEALRKAMNRDYRDFLKIVDTKKSNG